VLAGYFTREPQVDKDDPVRIPTRGELIAPTGAQKITRTVDVEKTPQLMQPTPLVQLTTNKLLGVSCPEGTNYCKLQAIHEFVRLNYEYTPATVEHTYIQAPDSTLLYGTGDELELALLIACMQRAAGFENEILHGTYHTFVRVHSENETYMIDPSCPSCKLNAIHGVMNGYEKVYR
jgi:hypothetical protein